MPRRRRGSHPRAGPSLAPRRSSSPASFNSLPPELRAKIALYARENHKADRRNSYDRRSSKQDKCERGRKLVKTVRAMAFRASGQDDGELASMMRELWDQTLRCKSDFAALSLVDRATYVALRHETWRHVNLAGRNTSAILFFLEHILPQHAVFVTSLAWSTHHTLGLWFFEERVGESSTFTPVIGFRSLEEERVVKVAERLAGLSPKASLGLRRVRVPALLLNEILRRCPNLSAVHFEEYTLPTYESGCPAFLPNYALYPLLEAGPRLTTLRVSFSRRSFPVLHLLLTNAHLLARVHLDSQYGISKENLASDEFIALLTLLAELTQLQVLKLDLPLPPSFYTLTFSSSLRYLRMCQPNPPSFSTLSTFISQFSATLSRLELIFDPDRDPHTADNPDGTRPAYGTFPPPAADGTYPPLNLPHLERLHLGVGYRDHRWSHIEHPRPEAAVLGAARREVVAFLRAFCSVTPKTLRIAVFPVFDKEDIAILCHFVRALAAAHPGVLEDLAIDAKAVRIRTPHWRGGTYESRDYTLDRVCREERVELRLLGKGGDADDEDAYCTSCYGSEEDVQDVSEEEWD